MSEPDQDCMVSQRPAQPGKIVLWLRQMRAPFITASVIPVLVGSCLGFAVTGTFHPLLFVLATLAIACLHSGANTANEYFDHLSGNDWLNENRNPFSGGSGLIQQGLNSPKAVFIGAWVMFAIGATLGAAILLITHSVFILVIGVIGLLGGYFYTANPLKLGYRSAGETVIALLFGILPVYGAYFLQTGTVDLVPLAPAIIISLLIFLIILINEFPDAPADAAVNKRTLVVVLGPKTASKIYQVALLLTYITAVAAIIAQPSFRPAGLLYMLTAPLAIVIARSLKTDTSENNGKLLPNKLTVLLHLTGGISLCAGFIISAIMN